MKSAAIILGGLGLLATTSAASPAMAAEHSSATHVTRAATATWWQPTNSGPNNGPEWQWELDHPLRVGNAADMGTGATNAAGAVAPNPTVYDIDGIENPASTVIALHALGDKVICYIEIGSAGNYYAASDEGIPVTYYAQLKTAGDLAPRWPGTPSTT